VIGPPSTADPGLGRAIVDAAVLRGHFVLRSGATSDYYIDKYRLTTEPRLLTRITDALHAAMPAEPVDRVAGTAVGAVPLATALSLTTGSPCVFVRVESKDHGTGSTIEGVLERGDRVVLVEDVVTTGGASLQALSALRDAGAEVVKVLAVVDREEGASARFAEAGVAFGALYTATALGLG
jgi:orotate phosphoribosyltransferase